MFARQRHNDAALSNAYIVVALVMAQYGNYLVFRITYIRPP